MYTWLFRACLAALITKAAVCAAAERPFDVRDDIAITRFGDENTNLVRAITAAPAPDLVAVYSEHGLLEQNKLEGSVRIYQLSKGSRPSERSRKAQSARLLWELRLGAAEDGPIIRNIQWLADSRAFAFLQKESGGKVCLMLADLARRQTQRLSIPGQDVTAYAVRSAKQYAYTVRSQAIAKSAAADEASSAITVTGRSLGEMLFPVNKFPSETDYYDRSDLWATQNSRPRAVMDPASGRSLVLYAEGQQALAISPDGQELLTALPVWDVPDAWRVTYPPPFPGAPYHFHSGVLQSNSLHGNRAARYAVVSLDSGASTWVSSEPLSTTAAWYAASVTPSWSPEGRRILLANTFVRDEDLGTSAIPCALAILDTRSRDIRCLAKAKRLFTASGTPEPGFAWYLQGRFLSSDRIVLESKDLATPTAPRHATFALQADGQWTEQSSSDDPTDATVQLKVSQSLNKPPVLVVSDAGSEEVLWEPNAWLKRVDIGQALRVEWRDKSQRSWVGGLFLPRNYVAGVRYPLVIQNHGFVEDEFRPSGLFPTAFAARALAGAGIAVLQVRDCPINDTPLEIQCQLEGYEGAITKLVTDGVIDADRVGIIGFSRTVSYVLAALVDEHMRFSAASITDGVNHGYLQYLYAVDLRDNEIANDTDAVIGAPSLIRNLPYWMSRAPTFNLGRVNAALQIVGEGRDSLLFMWEPYAALRYLDKPVEMTLLMTDEHVLTRPKVREASQGGTVDWFGFWLQGYEDPSLEKAEQYRRWENLCDLQRTQNPDKPAFCAGTRH